MRSSKSTLRLFVLLFVVTAFNIFFALRRSRALVNAIYDTIQTQEQSSPSPSTRAETVGTTTRHVLLGLSGNHSGFLGEFEVAFKSILLHAPSNDPLIIHIMADGEAYQALDDIIHKQANLTNWKTCVPTKIATYNVQSRQDEWKQRIETRLGAAANLTKHTLYRHTIGAYFRLFAGDVLPDSVDTVIYLDSDVVLLASLDDIWQRQLAEDTNKTKMYYWGEQRCSAFMVLRPHAMERVWEAYGKAPMKKIQSVLRSRPVVDDQFLLQVVHRTFPEVVGTLSPEWDVSASDGPWKGGKPHLLLPHRPKAGMLHFNGGRTSKEPYFKAHNYYLSDPVWSLAKYYVDMPWTWAQFAVESHIREGQGYPLVVDYNNEVKQDSTLPAIQ